MTNPPRMMTIQKSVALMIVVFAASSSLSPIAAAARKFPASVGMTMPSAFVEYDPLPARDMPQLLGRGSGVFKLDDRRIDELRGGMKSAAVLRVSADGKGKYSDIQSAIDAAPIDAIILLEDGIYTGTGNRDLDTRGKRLTIRSVSLDPTLCIIDPGWWQSGYHRGFNIHSGETAQTVIAGLGIRNAYVGQDVAGGQSGGGGIRCENAAPTIAGCVIYHCLADGGGGAIYMKNSSARVLDCVLDDCRAPWGIGATVHIIGSSEPDFERTVISHSFRSGIIHGGGAAVFAAGQSTSFEACHFLANVGYWCTAAVMHGGGMLNLSGCIFRQNLSVGSNEIVYSDGGEARVVHCTFFDNGGSALDFGFGSGAATIDSTIVSFSYPGSLDSVDAVPFVNWHGGVSLRSCDLFGNTGGDYVHDWSGQLGANGNIAADPLFCDAGAGLLSLSTSSPCLLAVTEQDTLAIGASVRVCSEGRVETARFEVAAPGLFGTGVVAAGWGDYDGDGATDVYVVRSSGANALYHNDGAGNFLDVTPPALAVVAEGRFCTWADYDDDGDLDLLVVNSGDACRLFSNDGNGFLDVTAELPVPSGDYVTAIWVDGDRDADLDLLLIAAGGAGVALRNDGGTLVRVAADYLAGTLSVTGCASADYDQDGDQDLCVTASLGGSRLYRNDGAMEFGVVDCTVLTAVDNATAAAWADFDLDGDQDLYVASGVGHNRLLRNESGVLLDVTDVVTGVDKISTGVVWLDYDRDGDDDLFVTTEQYVTGQGLAEQVLLRNDHGTFTAQAAGVLTAYYRGSNAGVADLDRDGRLDVLIPDDQAASPLRNLSDDANHWLAVRLEGRQSNRFGIGATVSGYEDGICIVHHEIGGGSSPAVRMADVATLGLGTLGGTNKRSSVRLDSLVVNWPATGRQIIADIPVDTMYVIVEPVAVASFPGWQMHQRDMQHTGRADFAVPTGRLNSSFFDLFRWQTAAPGSPVDGSIGATSLIFADGAGPGSADLVVGSYHWPKGVQGMDRHTGAVFWSGLPDGGESIADRSAAFSPDGGEIYVINDATESVNYPNGHPLMAFASVAGPSPYRHNGTDAEPGRLAAGQPVVSPDGRIFAHGWLHEPRAARDDGASLRESWAAQTHLECVEVDVALDLTPTGQLLVVAGGEYDGVFGFDGATGAELWHVAAPPLYATPTIDPASGHIFVAAGDAGISVVGIDRYGHPLWGQPARECYDGTNGRQRAFGCGCLSHDGQTYYFQTVGESGPGYLYAVDTATGDVRWQFPTGSQGWGDGSVSSPVVTRNGVIVVGNNAGSTYFAIWDRADVVLLDTLRVEAPGEARCSATISADGLLYLPLRTIWTVAGEGQSATGEVANLFSALDLADSSPYFGVLQESFDALATGPTQPLPGEPGQGGWYRELAAGTAYGEIQSVVAVGGRALHEHAPSDNDSGAQTMDRCPLSYELVGQQRLVLSADFLARSSSLAANNPYSASLEITGGPNPGYFLIGFGVASGNGPTREERRCCVTLSRFNGTDNLEAIELIVGQGLSWDQWHHVEVAIDHGSDTYLYVEVDGQRQNLVGNLPPRSYWNGAWQRGQRAEHLSAQVVALPWALPNATDDDIFWDNVTFQVEDALAAVEMSPRADSLRLRVVPNPFNATATVHFELDRAMTMSVRVYDVRGRMVRALHEGSLAAGRHGMPWNGRDEHGTPVAAGIYLVRVLAEDGHEAVRRIALVK